MWSKISKFLFGEVRISMEIAPSKGVNLLLKTGIPCYHEEHRNGVLCISLEKKDAENLISHLKKEEIPFHILYETGFFPTLYRAFLRPGLLLGVIFALLFVFKSSHYVWDTKIYGNERLSDKEVLKELSPYGFFVGCNFKNLDFHYICNDLPAKSKEIAWISVNMMGAVAEIQVVEYDAPKKEEPPLPPPNQGEGEQNRLVNLVAGEEGEILSYEIRSGKPLLNVGTVAEKGTMLVAGFSLSDSGLFPNPANGKVMARVHRFKERELPFKKTVMIEKKGETLQKSIKILGKEIFFYKNSRFLGEKYDTIDDEYRPTVFGIALPLEIHEKRILRKEKKEFLLTEEELLSLLQKELLSSVSKEEFLLEHHEFFFYKDNQKIRAVCRYTGICNIAVKKEIQLQNEG